jgi:cytochrome c oxidase subunit IV
VRHEARMTEKLSILVWLMLIALAALVSYLGLRGYLSPELLINFANAFYC